jgi:cation-dependent mannose-6-phosphate receptor
MAQLPPDDESACAYFIEWRTHVSSITIAQLASHLTVRWLFRSLAQLRGERAQEASLPSLPRCPYFSSRLSVCMLMLIFTDDSLLIAIVAYLVAGTLYNRFALGLRGMDQIPRISFFSFSDTMDFLKRITESCRGGSRPRQWGSWGERNRYSGFGRLAAEEEESIAHGRFSLEDEDEDEPPLPPLPPKNGQNGNIRLS